MTSKTTKLKLAEFNFRFVEDETGKFNGYTWSGTIEPIRPIGAEGESITWLRVCGNTRPEMDSHAMILARDVMEHAYYMD